MTSCSVWHRVSSFTTANAKESQAVVGLGQLNITQYASRDNNGTTFINVASDGCIPISFTAYGNGGTPSSMLFCSLYEVDIACASHFNIVTFSSGPTT